MFTTRPELLGTFGAVSSTHWLASAVGMAMLEKGGNAFDAAVAAGFTLQVVEPHQNGLGGEVPILFSSGTEDRVRVLCGQGVAPAKATIEHYRALGLDLVPGSGLLAAVVPGAFDAWMLLLRDYGSMRLADVMAPAVAYARDGHPLVQRASDTIETVKELFATEWPSSAALYLKNGQVPAPGSILRNPDLALTYSRIVREAEVAGRGRDDQIEAARRLFYGGFVAEAIERFCAGTEVVDTSGRRHRGLLTGDDLARWQATYEDPITHDYHGHTVAKVGPWSQAPVFLQQLALLEGFDLAALDPDGPDFVHTVVECAKLAFADREAYYGDPDFGDVPVDALLDGSYNDARRRLVGETASDEMRPGDVSGYDAAARIAATARLAKTEVGDPSMASIGGTRRDTCHLDVVDRAGNMVAATPSGGWLQSSPVIPGLGFPLTTRGQMFWLEDGLPNSLAPGKRPRTTLTPSLAIRDGRPYLAFGTPGGDQQDQWALSFFLRHVHHGDNLQEAIDAPTFHTEHFPSSFHPRDARPGHLAIEDRFPPETVKELRRRGHQVEVVDGWSLGCVCAVAADGPLLRGAANPRRMQAYAAGR